MENFKSKCSLSKMSLVEKGSLIKQILLKSEIIILFTLTTNDQVEMVTDKLYQNGKGQFIVLLLDMYFNCLQHIKINMIKIVFQ